MKLIYTLSLVILLSSCSDRVKRERLIGRYVFNYWSKDTIVLRSNGTYKHFLDRNGKRLKDSGKWKLNTGNEITFEDFSFSTDRRPKGLWISRIRIKNNEVHLMYAEEENYYYNKID